MHTKNSITFAASILLVRFCLCAAQINVDFNGVRNGDGSLTTPGPTYAGQGAAGGGTVWSGVLADSRVEVGSPDNDALYIEANNLLDSMGNSTPLWFTLGPVAAGNQGAVSGSDPTLLNNLLLDWVLVGYYNETIGTADFTIGGLGTAPTVDLYFYHRGDFPGRYTIAESSPTPFAGVGLFNAGNTVFYRAVPVVDGQIAGQFSEGDMLMGLCSGFTVVMPDPGPYLKSTSPSGTGVSTNTPIQIEIYDYLTQLNPASVQLFLNEQPITPVTAERVPAEANYWTITAQPAAGFREGISNVVRVVFSDTSNPPVSRSALFGFFVPVGSEGHRAINLDINGWRESDPTPVTYVGQGVAGGGTVFNAVAADSTWGDDKLTIGATNLLDSIGDPTMVSFTLGPVAGENMSTATSPSSKNNLFADFAAVGFQGQDTGNSDFTISGLGAVPTVDLYFYFREDPQSDGLFAGSKYTVAGTETYPFAPHGIFNSGNTVYIKNAPVVNGQLSGVFSGQVGGGGEGSAAGALSGLTIQLPLPQPYVRKASPRGDYVQPEAPLQIELQDYVTSVDTNTIQLKVNGQGVVPAVNKASGAVITIVTYSPPRGWIAEATNTISVIFASQSASPAWQTNEFNFFVISPLKASRIVNIDINGVGHSTLPLGPAYVGSGAAGGGQVFNAIVAQTRQPDGTDDDAIVISGANLLDSLGGPTAFSFSLGPVGAGNSGAVGGEFSENWSALNHDWAIVGYFNAANSADFTIAGLGKAPTANLYFYFREDDRENRRFGAGSYVIPGASAKRFPGCGVFGYWNTTYFERVPVVNGTITGRWNKTSVLALMTGLTIELPLPHAYLTSRAPEGGGWPLETPVKIELNDFDVVQVDPQSIVLSINGQMVTPNLNKPSDSVVTTVTYAPANGWPDGSSNHVKIVFSDTAAPVLLQTNEFDFTVVERRVAANIINVDINGSRNGDGGLPEIGPTYIGQSAPGGGRIWNGVVADSRLPDGQDDDVLFFSAANLVNSQGAPTSLTFEMGPVAGGNQGTPSVATDPLALYYDWVLVGYFGETIGVAEFTIGGLGTNTTADLYFYHRGDYPGTYVIPGATPAFYSGTGTFDAGHVVYYQGVPIVNGKITGQLTEGASVLGLVSGFSLAFPTPVIPQPEPLSITMPGQQLIITWSGIGTLQSAANVLGPWTDLNNATSPYSVTPSGAHMFFRLRN